MHNRIKALFCLALVAATVGFAKTAAAAVVHPKLDSVASEFAGHPMVVDCYTDSGADVHAWDITYQLYGVYGVFYPSMPNDVFLSPAACQPLLTTVNSSLQDAGLRPFAVGALTLVHESFHARGWVNEADTEACAMKYLPRAMQDFGVYPTKTIAVKKTVTRWVRRKVGKRIVRVRSSRVVTVHRNVANPDYGHVIGWATENHNTLPPQYLNGTCNA
jgi:hypothetical protein